MSTSTARCAWAIASSFSSLLALATTATAAPQAASAYEQSLAMELELARTPELYLVLDPQAGRLDVKVRGLVLESVTVADAALLVHSASERRSAPAALPAGWTVSSIPDHSRRRVLEAGALKPYGEEEASDAAATPAAATEPEVPEPPARYRVPLEGGWELRVGPSARRGWLVRSLALTAERLRAGGDEEGFRPPDIVAMTLVAEDARKIHHLFRPGVEILAVVTAPVGALER